MKRERAKELLPIFEAFANGEDIQFRASWCKTPNYVEEDWIDLPENDDLRITFPAPDYEYRIKPKPREGWCHKDSFEECPISPDMTSDDWIKVREVISNGD